VVARINTWLCRPTVLPATVSYWQEKHLLSWLPPEQYSGVSGPLLTVGVVQSLNFAVYDRTRQYLHSQRLSPPPGQQGFTISTHYLTEDSLSGVATAGMVSGMTIACITAPLVMIKTNQQITGNSFRQALQESFYMNGRVNLFAGAAGFLPHVIGESVGRSIYYFAYEGLKRSWASAKAANHGVPSANGSTSATTSLQERMVCAAMSGITCWAAIFPLDALRSRLYAAAAVSTQPTDALSQYQSTSSRQLLMDTIRQMRQERSFYRGFWVTVLRAGPVAAAVLPVYDLTLETLASPQH
jgi:Mitochondrial carrier protein